MPTHRTRTEQFKLYLSTAERAALAKLSREWRCTPSAVLRALLQTEATRVQSQIFEETISPSGAAASVDTWRAQRAERRARRGREPS
jgi:hypothetical protein